MADITVRISGVNDVIAALEAVKKRVDLATRIATQESGRKLQSDARGNFAGSHPGGFHHVGGNRPEIRVTGHLQASILDNASRITRIGR